MYFITQSGKEDCAFTCLAMLLSYYHKDKNYLFLPHDDRPYSYKELIDKASEFNTELKAVRILGIDELIKNKEFPIICTLKGGGKTKRHSVIVLSANRFRVKLYDPIKGKCSLRTSEFDEKWNKQALIVTNNQVTSCPYMPQKLSDEKDKIYLTIFQILSGLSLLVGTYYLNNKELFYIPIIFFSLFIIFELCFRRYQVYAMGKIDQNIYSHKINKPSDGYLEVFDVIQKYRTGSLTLSSSLIYQLLIVIFLAVIFIMNSVWNAFYILLAFSIGLFEYFVISPYFKNKEDKLIELEEKVISSQEDYEFQNFALQCSQKALKIGFMKTLVHYLEIGLIIIVTLCVMFFTSEVNITYVVFYTAINVMLMESFKKIFDFTNMNDHFDSVKAKLLNYLNSKDEKNDYL